jgi:hypothetical protein
LGLAIAKSVAEAHEGFVDIVDTPGWSTTFRVFLPLRSHTGAGAGASNGTGPGMAAEASAAAEAAGARASSGRSA